MICNFDSDETLFIPHIVHYSRAPEKTYLVKGYFKLCLCKIDLKHIETWDECRTFQSNTNIGYRTSFLQNFSQREHMIQLYFFPKKRIEMKKKTRKIPEKSHNLRTIITKNIRKVTRQFASIRHIGVPRWDSNMAAMKVYKKSST